MRRRGFLRGTGFGPWVVLALTAGPVAASCGARTPILDETGAAGGATTATVGSGGALASSSSSPPSAIASSSSASSTGGPTCSSDADCGGIGFCWLGTCVKINVLVAGSDQACAVTSAGGVQCWGDNSFGELGGDACVNSFVPIPVTGLDASIAGVTAGADHECAWTTGGAVQCWGQNGNGQLGDGTLGDSAAPVDVIGLQSGVAVVSAGAQHTCAVTTAGAVLCWGANDHGQLGNGTTTEAHTPVPVAGLTSGIRDVSGGDSHTCALTTGGTVLCWGLNMNGQLGNGGTSQSAVPVSVGLPLPATAISAGGLFTCAVAAGGAYCWGGNNDGELGNGNTNQSYNPVHVSGLSQGVAGIAAGPDDVGHEHACAFTASGLLFCWGFNTYGQLGDGSQMPSPVPVGVVGLTGAVTALATGDGFTCALVAGIGVECWGENTDGELGDDSVLSSLVPSPVLEP